MKQKIYLGLILVILAVGLFLWWDFGSRSLKKAPQAIDKTSSANSKSSKVRKELKRIDESQAEQPKPSEPAGWRDLKKRYPNLVVEKKEKVHFSDGSVEVWSLMRTSAENDQLWVVKEASDGFEAATAGEILMRIKTDDQLRAFESLARESGFEFELQDPDLGIYSVRFDPEDMSLYREAMERLNEISDSGSEVLPNRMVGVW